MPTETELAHLKLVIDDHTAIVPCLELVVYLDSALDDSVLEFYERARMALGEQLGFYQAESMKRPAPLDDKAWQLVPTWIKRPRLGKAYYAFFTGAPAGKGASAATLKLVLHARANVAMSAERRASMKELYEKQGCRFSPPVSSLRVTLPLDHPLTVPDKFLAWALDFQAIRARPFVSGHAGLALNYDEAVSRDQIRHPMEARLAALCLRHPGLDWDNTGSVQNHLLRWEPTRGDFVPLIKRVNWLTLVSARTLAWLGDQERLRKLLGSDLPITVHPLEHGVAIQAGPVPQLGDAARRDVLPVYRRVAAALAKVRLESHQGVGRGFSEEAAQAWLEGLDRTYE